MYIDLPYFEDDEAQQLKFKQVDGTKTIAEVTEERLAAKLAHGTNSHEPCTKNDIAPPFERACGIDGEKLNRNTKFKSFLIENGLRSIGDSSSVLTRLTNLKAYEPSRSTRNGN